MSACPVRDQASTSFSVLIRFGRWDSASTHHRRANGGKNLCLQAIPRWLNLFETPVLQSTASAAGYDDPLLFSIEGCVAAT